MALETRLLVPCSFDPLDGTHAAWLVAGDTGDWVERVFCGGKCHACGAYGGIDHGISKKREKLAMRVSTVVDPQEKQGKPKQLGIDFNQLIAKTHRFNSQMIGLQLTMGNMIALCLSASQITAGVIALLWVKVQWLSLCSALLCFPLSIVIERLSLGGLMILRTVNKELAKVEHAYQKRVIKLRNKGGEPSEGEKYDYEQIVKHLKRNRWLAIPIIVLGIVISGAVGDQIWQDLFQSLNSVVGISLSLCCAFTISLTFVFSELFREMADEGLVDIIQDDRIEMAVLAHGERGMQIDIAMQAFANVRSDPQKNAKEVVKVERVLGSRVSAFAEYVEERGLGSISGLQEIGSGQHGQSGRQLEARVSSKRRYEACSEDLGWYVQRYPHATCQMVSSEFGISRSTAKVWLARLREETQEGGFLSHGEDEGVMGGEEVSEEGIVEGVVETV